MEQFKAEWQYNVVEHENPALATSSVSLPKTIDHLITQHNALVDYLADWKSQAFEQAEVHEVKAGIKTITLPKPEWYELAPARDRECYREALEAASKASGITFLLED